MERLCKNCGAPLGRHAVMRDGKPPRCPGSSPLMHDGGTRFVDHDSYVPCGGPTYRDPKERRP